MPRLILSLAKTSISYLAGGSYISKPRVLKQHRVPKTDAAQAAISAEFRWYGYDLHCMFA